MIKAHTGVYLDGERDEISLVQKANTTALVVRPLARLLHFFSVEEEILDDQPSYRFTRLKNRLRKVSGSSFVTDQERNSNKAQSCYVYKI